MKRRINMKGKRENNCVVNIDPGEWKIIYDIFEMHQGYVLNFTDKSFSFFIYGNSKVNIDDEKYKNRGSSKANRFRSFIEQENPHRVAEVLRKMLEYKRSLQESNDSDLSWGDISSQSQEEDPNERLLLDLINKLEGGYKASHSDVLLNPKCNETLEILIDDINEYILNELYPQALDRLHTYCVNKFRNLIKSHSGTYENDNSLQSLVGTYIKLYKVKGELGEFSCRAFKCSISLFERFNDIRNNESLAHDNIIMNKRDARYVIDIICTTLRYTKAIDEKYSE